jgi:hypothetical protein
VALRTRPAVPDHYVGHFAIVEVEQVATDERCGRPGDLENAPELVDRLLVLSEDRCHLEHPEFMAGLP